MIAKFYVVAALLGMVSSAHAQEAMQSSQQRQNRQTGQPAPRAPQKPECPVRSTVESHSRSAETAALMNSANKLVNFDLSKNPRVAKEPNKSVGAHGKFVMAALTESRAARSLTAVTGRALASRGFVNLKSCNGPDQWKLAKIPGDIPFGAIVMWSGGGMAVRTAKGCVSDIVRATCRMPGKTIASVYVKIVTPVASSEPADPSMDTPAAEPAMAPASAPTKSKARPGSRRAPAPLNNPDDEFVGGG